MPAFPDIPFATIQTPECRGRERPSGRQEQTGRMDMEAVNMGEKFYRELDEFQAKYPTVEEREQALRTMSAEQILQLSRSCGTLKGAIWYARFAQAAAERNG